MLLQWLRTASTAQAEELSSCVAYLGDTIAVKQQAGVSVADTYKMIVRRGERFDLHGCIVCNHAYDKPILSLGVHTNYDSFCALILKLSRRDHESM